LWEKIPDFQYTAPDLAWVLSRQQLSLTMLLAWTVAAVLLAWTGVRTLRVQ
jgi:hypothetical protein